MPSPRRLLPPWIAEETEACFIVCDATGQAREFAGFSWSESGP
jgi:hypothetical protein